MTRREALALVMDERDNQGDETVNMGEMDADLAFQMRTSIRLIKAEKRVTALEQDLEKHRHAINRCVGMLEAMGRTWPTDIYADSLDK